ncbi:hypothetical protein TNCV_1332591 [Trichonephila clavipes]|nr:hypothetical protein TNCV_1332591 [Trichonephila clavipes]
MASAVLADPTRVLQGTNRGSRPAMKVSENDVGSIEQLLLYADEHYLAGKLPLGLGKGPQVLAVRSFDPSLRGLPGHPDPVFRTWVVSTAPATISNGTLRTICPATRRVDQPTVFILLIRPLSNSLNSGMKNVWRLQGKHAAGTVVEFEAGASLFPDPISDVRQMHMNVVKCSN